MSLKLHFTAKARLWAEVVLPQGDRVFIASTETPAVGETVAVSIEAPELPIAILVNAVVKAHRPATPLSAPGVVVTFDTAAVDKVRTALGGQRDDHARIAGRVEPRVECNVPARVLSPTVIEGCAVKSLSASGLTLHTSVALQNGSTHGVQLRLADGEALVTATVVWSRPELGLSGLRMTSVDTVTAQRLRAAIDVLTVTRPEAVAPGAALVVVADDDPSILDFMSRVLSKAGHRVLPADRGDTALQLIRHEKPRMAFLDVLMPGLDGLEVCKSVRADVLLARIPIVLMSAMGEQRLTEAAATAQASDFLTKPMHLEAVRAVMSKYLRDA